MAATVLHSGLSGAGCRDATYTGRRRDRESGLSYYRARLLHAHLGRFCSRDLVGYEAGANLAEYVWDSPTSRVDSFGMQAFPPCPITTLGQDCAPTSPGGWQTPPPLSKIFIDLMSLIPESDGRVYCNRGGYATNTHMCWDWGCGFDWAPMGYFKIEGGDWIAFTVFTCDEFRTMAQRILWNRRQRMCA